MLPSLVEVGDGAVGEDEEDEVLACVALMVCGKSEKMKTNFVIKILKN